MPYLVYIIESENNRILYKGYTTDIEKRLYEHNNNLGRYAFGMITLKKPYF